MLKSESASSLHLHASVSSATGAVGLVVGAAPDMSEYTHIIFEPSNSTLLVVRDHSSKLGDNFNTATVTGYFAPYVQMVNGKEVTEEIVMDVVLDGSLLEVYLNDRFALATRIYPASSCSTGECCLQNLAIILLMCVKALESMSKRVLRLFSQISSLGAVFITSGLIDQKIRLRRLSTIR